MMGGEEWGEQQIGSLGLTYTHYYYLIWASRLILVIKSLPANAGNIREVGSVPRSGRFSGGGHGNSL